MCSYSQSTVIADPAVGLMDLTDISGNSLNANTLMPGDTWNLKLPVYNLSQDMIIPAGSGRLVISLGDKLILDPSFDLSNAPLSEYFEWTSAVVFNELVITGNLIADFPADLYSHAMFSVKGNTTCTATLTARFNVTNHNTSTTLIDEDILNNSGSLQYTVNTITANNDNVIGLFDGATGGIAVDDILINDELNCAPALISDVNISLVTTTHPGISIIGSAIHVAPGTPGGTHAVTYRICSSNNSANCSTGTVTLKIKDPTTVLLTSVYPNPYTDVINFRVTSPVNGKTSIILYDLLGQRIAVLPPTDMEAGVQKIITYKVNGARKIVMLYKLTIGGYTMQGKVIPGN
jgi:hypothetical protein